MAKKNRTRSKKKISSAKPRSYSQLYKNDKTVPTASSAAPAQAKEPAPQAVEVESDDRSNWKNEYAYVVRDMRMLTIVSVALFALIIIAGFFI